MIDRENVIKGLEKCRRYECDNCTEKDASQAPWDCPVYDDFVDSAISLLKEQEAGAEPGHWVVLENCSNAGVYCSECNTKIFDHYPMKKKYSYFCPHCGTRMEGQAVKWND